MQRLASKKSQSKSKKPSRASIQEELRSQAAQLALPAHCDICVVGAGASGLAAAISAAQKGATVIVLEQALECGKTILATGNGRCNICNTTLDPARYNNPTFVDQVFGNNASKDIEQFFKNCGLYFCEEDTRLYPLSRQAASVRNVLLAQARRLGILLAPGREVQSISADKQGGFTLHYSELFHADAADLKTLHAQATIFAAGGRARKGRIFDNLGLRLREETAVLCPLACEDSPFTALDGRRAQVQAQLVHKHKIVWQETGEVLFRSYGLSGIVSFDMSRRAHKDDVLILDLAPTISYEELCTLIASGQQGRPWTGALDGILDPKIARLLEELAQSSWDGYAHERALACPHDHSHDCGHQSSHSYDQQNPISRLALLVKALPFGIQGRCEQASAQVFSGGICCDQFDTSSLACKHIPGLYACGENLDIDADCGGFNLAWAWKSGMIAGLSAAASTSR